MTLALIIDEPIFITSLSESVNQMTISGQVTACSQDAEVASGFCSVVWLIKGLPI